MAETSTESRRQNLSQIAKYRLCCKNAAKILHELQMIIIRCINLKRNKTAFQSKANHLRMCVLSYGRVTLTLTL